MDPSKFSFSFITTFSIGYLTFCGALWHLGYWSTFHFNFLEYASIADLFKSTIYPFFSGIWIFLCLMIFPSGMWFIGQMSPKFPQSKSLLQQMDEMLITKSAKFIISALLGMSALAIAFNTILTSGHNSLSILPISIAVFVGLLMFKTDFLKVQMPREASRVCIILFLCIYASYNFWTAKRKALEIDCLFRYQNVAYIDTGDSLTNKDIIGLPYLGCTDKQLFFAASGRIVILKADLVKQIVLEPKVVDSNYHWFLQRRP